MQSTDVCVWCCPVRVLAGRAKDVGCVNSGPYLLTHCGGAALKRCLRSVDVERHLRGRGIDDPAASLSSLTDVRLVLGSDVTDVHVHEAVILHREVLAALRQLHGGVDHSDVAAAMDSLARAVFSGPNADLAEVSRLHRDSLSMRRRLHGADSEDDAMAQSLGHLAAVMSLRGDSSEALRLHRESLAMLRRVQGASADVPAVAASLSTVAEALHAKHQLAESVVTPWRGARRDAAAGACRQGFTGGRQRKQDVQLTVSRVRCWHTVAQSARCSVWFVSVCVRAATTARTISRITVMKRTHDYDDTHDEVFLSNACRAAAIARRQSNVSGWSSPRHCTRPESTI